MANIIGTSGNDTLNGTPNNDRISGLAGNDALNRQTGNETQIGGVATTHSMEGSGTIRST